jgi:hypothetical protein
MKEYKEFLDLLENGDQIKDSLNTLPITPYSFSRIPIFLYPTFDPYMPRMKLNTETSSIEYLEPLIPKANLSSLFCITPLKDPFFC